MASYVWGQGLTGYGPHRLAEILAEPGLADCLAQAAEALRSHGAVASYGVLRGAIKGLGPAFFTKLLYFLGPAGGTVPPPAPLILDMRVARVLRAYAAGISEQMGEVRRQGGGLDLERRRMDPASLWRLPAMDDCRE